MKKIIATFIMVCVILLGVSIRLSVQHKTYIEQECQYYGLSKTCTVQHIGLQPQMYSEWPWGFQLIDSNGHQIYFSFALNQNCENHEGWEREIQRYYICDSCWIIEETDCSHTGKFYRIYEKEGPSYIETSTDTFPSKYSQQIQKVVVVNLDAYYSMVHQRFSIKMILCMEICACVLLIIILTIFVVEKNWKETECQCNNTP